MSNELATLEAEVKEYRLQVSLKHMGRYCMAPMLTGPLSTAGDSSIRSPGRSRECGAAESQN